MLLTDIKRSEVIRGPGTALLGYHTAKGITNIITKPKDTKDGLEMATYVGLKSRFWVSCIYLINIINRRSGQKRYSSNE